MISKRALQWAGRDARESADLQTRPVGRAAASPILCRFCLALLLSAATATAAAQDAQRADKVQPAPAKEAAPAKTIRAVRIGPDLGTTEETVNGKVQPAKTVDAQAELVAKRSAGVLSLVNGNTIAGRLRPSDSSSVIRWQGTDFVEPFEVLTDAIKSIKFPAARERTAQQGEFAFEMLSGDLLAGSLVDWTPTTIRIDSTLFGEVAMRPDAIRRVYRIEENPTIVFASLAGLQDWTNSNWQTEGWQEDGAHLWTDQPDATLNGDLRVPELAMIEFEISWSEKANFVFAIAVDTGRESDSRTDGWRFETFEQTLAVVRESRSIADVARVESLADKKSIRLLAYLDQTKGRLQVYQPDGTLLATIDPDFDLQADAQQNEPAKVGRGVRLINRHGDLRLERLRIARWSGKAPTSASTGDISVALADGTIASGTSIRMNAENQELILGDRDGEIPVPLQDVVAVKIAGGESVSGPINSSLFLHDGSRISGEIESISADRWQMRSDEFNEPIEVPRELVRTFIVMRRDPIIPPANQSGRSGRLELGEHVLTGRLVPETEKEEQGISCLRWQPFGSLNSSPLKMDVAGRVIYREPPPPVDPQAQATAARALQMQKLRLQQQQRGLNFGQLFLEKADSKPIARVVTPDAHKLHVRSGDVIPCLVESVDELGVYITTAVADDTFVPHNKIKAIELVSNVSPPDLKEAKKERLLTLPRLQKSSPPTHLLCSRNGDFLRCRLLSIGDETIRVELQLEEVEIPRSRVAQIIWFHPEELLKEQNAAEQGEQAAVEVASPFARMAQVLKRDGKRVTFDPQQVDDKMILGTSDVLGPCRFELSEIDQLLFGEGIRDAVAVLPYNQWQLRPAIEPLMAQNLPGGPEVGSESPLIGKEAPEIKLDMLDGERFVLSECKDQIVVLDFWATWCAPCMQTMPLVEEAMAEFDPQQVRLVSVNLEESPDHIRSVLQRHGLDLEVALDIDGVAALRYEARAIPQMVIVGKDGKVARLYVGGGSRMVEEMKSAIAQLIEPAS